MSERCRQNHCLTKFPTFFVYELCLDSSQDHSFILVLLQSVFAALQGLGFAFVYGLFVLNILLIAHVCKFNYQK